MSGISHLIRGRPMGAGMARRDWLDFMPEVDSAIFMPAISASGGALLGAATAEEGDRARAALLGGALGAGAGYGLHRGGLIRKEIKKMPDSRRAWKNLKELQKITKKHPRKYPVAQYLTENSGISEPSAFNRFLERHPQVEKALIDNIEPIGAGLGALAAGGAYSLADSFMQ
jgi:hypothetical protein